MSRRKSPSSPAGYPLGRVRRSHSRITEGRSIPGGASTLQRPQPSLGEGEPVASVVLWNTRRFGIEVDALFVSAVVVAGALASGFTLATSWSRPGGLPPGAAWAWASPAFVSASIATHELAHAIALRAVGHRGRIVIHLADGGGTTPLLRDPTKRALTAFAGPLWDALTVSGIAAAWKLTAPDSAWRYVTELGAATQILLMLIAFAPGQHNDVRVVRSSLTHSKRDKTTHEQQQQRPGPDPAERAHDHDCPCRPQRARDT